MKIRRPFDAHLHLRDGAMLAAVLPATTEHCDAALVMPNLTPPVTTRSAAQAYRARILAARPEGSVFEPLLTAYLTDGIDPDELVAGFEAGDWVAAKLYPAHATTNSSHGVTDVRHIDAALAAMASAGMPLCVHGEVTDPEVDIFDREARFLDTVLAPLLDRHPDLRVVVEHATTRAAVDFVAAAGSHVGMSITAHHLWWNRNALFQGGLRPHAYCLPVLKREDDRLALVEAATSGDPRIFFGSDSAPHLVGRKESDCGCAGVFSAPTAVQTVAEVFAAEQALDRLEGFLSTHGPRWYGRQPSQRFVFVAEQPHTVEPTLASEDGPVRVFRGGEPLPWAAPAWHAQRG